MKFIVALSVLVAVALAGGIECRSGGCDGDVQGKIAADGSACYSLGSGGSMDAWGGDLDVGGYVSVLSKVETVE